MKYLFIMQRVLNMVQTQKTPKTFEDIRKIVANCNISWIGMSVVCFQKNENSDPYLQIINTAPPAWSGRKWRVSVHSTESEIVQTALKAFITALEHEARESFQYKGVTIFDPHFNVNELVKLREKGKQILDLRDDSMNGA